MTSKLISKTARRAHRLDRGHALAAQHLVIGAEQQSLHRFAVVGGTFDRQVRLGSAGCDHPRLGQLHRAQHRDAALLVEVDADRQVDLLRPRIGVEDLDQGEDGVARKGLDELRKAIFKHAPGEQAAEWVPGSDARGVDAVQPAHKVYRPTDDEGFSVEEIEPQVFAVRGKGIELLLARFNTNNDEALRHVEQRMRQIGVIRELQRKGFESGDEIEIGGQRFALSAPFGTALNIFLPVVRR